MAMTGQSERPGKFVLHADICVSLICFAWHRFSATRERPRTVKEEIGKVFCSMLQLDSHFGPTLTCFAAWRKQANWEANNGRCVPEIVSL